jgi:hypothetical protein
MQQWLAGQLRFLKQKALTGKPVNDWILYTKQNQDEPGNQAIAAALKAGATFDHLLMFDPEIAQNPTLRLWFQQFYDGLKRPDSVSQTTAVPWIGRDITNAAGNGGAGEAGQPAATGATPGATAAEPGKP